MSTNSNQLKAVFLALNLRIGHDVLLLSWQAVLQPILRPISGELGVGDITPCRIGDIFVNAVASLAAEGPPTRSGGWANETDGPIPESRPREPVKRCVAQFAEGRTWSKGSGCRMVT